MISEEFARVRLTREVRRQLMEGWVRASGPGVSTLRGMETGGISFDVTADRAMPLGPESISIEVFTRQATHIAFVAALHSLLSRLRQDGIAYEVSGRVEEELGALSRFDPL